MRLEQAKRNKGAGEGEHAAEAVGGRAIAGDASAKGCDLGKLLSPERLAAPVACRPGPSAAALYYTHPPTLDHNLRLLQRVKDFPVQALVSQLTVEALAVSVFLRTPAFE